MASVLLRVGMLSRLYIALYHESRGIGPRLQVPSNLCKISSTGNGWMDRYDLNSPREEYKWRTDKDPALSLVEHQLIVCLQKIWIPSELPDRLIPAGRKQTIAKVSCG